MSTKLITDNYKILIANKFIESVDTETAYYLYVGNHVPSANSQIPTANNNQRSVFIDPYRNMIMGKRVGVNDVTLMVRNIPYTSNTVYTMYDDIESNLDDKNFFVVVNEGSYHHVYKCLDNNNNSPSTVEPEFAHVNGANTYLYQTSDGYRWRYMYSVSSSDVAKFATTDYFPLVANTEVSNQAVAGAIDVIKIESGGRGYDNYTSGIFSSGDIKYLGVSTLYEISNTAASSLDGFYEGCILYITNGPGAGAFRKINAYSIQSGRKIISIDAEFDTNNAPAAGSEYQIYPEVRVYGDGNQTVNAVARALVNSTASNSVYRIEILNRGRDYQYATANVIANSVVLVDRAASLRPIYGPFGGHGKNQASELAASRVCVSVKFANNESNTILSDNGFQQIGIIKDPKFSNVQIDYDTLYGQFSTGETAYKIDPVFVTNGVSVSTLSDVINAPSGNFTTQFAEDDYVYLTSADNLNHQITRVVSVTNNESMKIASNGFFSSVTASIYMANVSTSAIVSDIEADFVYLNHVSGIIGTGDILVGNSSGAQMNVTSIERNNVTKTFNTFVQLNKFECTSSSGSFLENEVIYQGTSNNQTANAYLHSVINTGAATVTVYTSNQVGSFIEGDPIRGATSGAVATINNKYSPELVFGSGDILYFENIEKITRSVNESETFKVVLEF